MQDGNVCALRVLIDTTYARRAPLSGTGIYIRKLCEELTGVEGVEPIEGHDPNRRAPGGGGLGSVRNLLADRWWTAVGLPRLARRVRADVIHHPLPAHVGTTKAAQVVTVADVAYERLPACFDRRFRTYAHISYRAAARAVEVVICISNTTAADVCELWGVPHDRIVVAPLGPGQIHDRGQPEGSREAEGARRTDPRHFLYVGDDEPRKNLSTLLGAYALYRRSEQRPLPLILAGSATASAPGIEVVHRPGPEHLRELYAAAAALIQPSLYEGFGLTALEAMAIGTPVIAAQSPGLTEMCAAAVRYADPRDAGSFAAAMAEIARDPALRAELAKLGLRRAAEFSWARCAQAHLDAYSLAQTRA